LIDLISINGYSFLLGLLT